MKELIEGEAKCIGFHQSLCIFDHEAFSLKGTKLIAVFLQHRNGVEENGNVAVLLGGDVRCDRRGLRSGLNFRNFFLFDIFFFYDELRRRDSVFRVDFIDDSDFFRLFLFVRREVVGVKSCERTVTTMNNFLNRSGSFQLEDKFTQFRGNTCQGRAGLFCTLDVLKNISDFSRIAARKMLSIFLSHTGGILASQVLDDRMPELFGDVFQFGGAIMQDVCIDCTEHGMHLLVSVKQIHNKIGNFFLENAYFTIHFAGGKAQNVQGFLCFNRDFLGRRSVYIQLEEKAQHCTEITSLIPAIGRISAKKQFQSLFESLFVVLGRCLNLRRCNLNRCIRLENVRRSGLFGSFLLQGVLKSLLGGCGLASFLSHNRPPLKK